MTDVKGYALSLLYEKVAEYLREFGWIQHAAFGEDGTACLVGACLKVAYAVTGTTEDTTIEDDDDESHEVLEAMLQPLRSSLYGMGEIPDIAYWNDDEHRTEEDVQLFLKQAAEKAREE